MHPSENGPHRVHEIQANTVAKMTLEMKGNDTLQGFLETLLAGENAPSPEKIVQDYSGGNEEARAALLEALDSIGFESKVSDVETPAQEEVSHTTETTFSKDARDVFMQMSSVDKRRFIEDFLKKGKTREEITTMLGFSDEEQGNFFPPNDNPEAPVSSSEVPSSQTPPQAPEPARSPEVPDVLPEQPERVTPEPLEHPKPFKRKPGTLESWIQSPTAWALVMYATKAGMTLELIGGMLWNYGFKDAEERRGEVTPISFASYVHKGSIKLDNYQRNEYQKLDEDTKVEACELVRAYVRWLIAYQERGLLEGRDPGIRIDELNPNVE